MCHYCKVNVPIPLWGVSGNVNFQNLFQFLVETFHLPYGLGMLYSSVVDLDSGSFHYFGLDAGCESCTFVSDNCLRDVGVLGEYLHECLVSGSVQRTDNARSSRTPSGCAYIRLN